MMPLKESENDQSKFHWSFGDHDWFFTTIHRVVEIFQSGNKVVDQSSDQHCHPYASNMPKKKESEIEDKQSGRKLVPQNISP